jgi:site-specific recombinase XerC
MHVTAWIELQGREVSAPSVKQRLAAIRHLFDWLVTGHIVNVHPAASVRGPRHVVRTGKAPVLEPAEARRLLDSIDASTPAGLRDKALIGLMVYSFARVGAALAMRAEDVYTQNRLLWVRLHEKGGKHLAMPCHHSLDEILEAYIAGAGLAGNPKDPRFCTIGRSTGQLTHTPLPQANAHAMIRRRDGRQQGPDRQPHLPRHRHHGVSQERRHAQKVAAMANHTSTRTTQLYAGGATRCRSMRSSGY